MALNGITRLAGAACLSLCFAGQGVAQTPVDLELVLAVDVSMSMDFEEQKLQRDGYVAAFRHPEVIAAIRSGGLGRIAVIYVEWAGVARERIVQPWTLIDGEQTALAFAAALETAIILPQRRTSISNAINYSASLFANNEYEGVRRVIDVSGDGPNNQGEPVENARDKAVAQGITINGLPILLKGSTPSAMFDIANLDTYYEDCVIGGQGAFLIPVTAEKEFAAAIRRKLILEIARAEPRIMPAQFTPLPQRSRRTDCLMGEKLWYRWMLDVN